ncbi:hypothetical protein J6590_074200 [Homalodisca vitripennis]|nr:hypothetical protein J6590_074200 [Homalodisca vitripennis]
MKKATKAQKQPILDPIVGGLLQSSGGTSVHLCHSEQHKLKSCKVVLHRLKEFQNADHRPVPPMIEREVIVDESLRHLSPIELLEHIHNKVSQEGMVYDEKTSASESGSDKVADLGEFYEANMSPTELNENIDTDNYQVGPPMENPEVDIDDISINQLDFLRSKDYLPIIPDPQMTSSCIRPVGDLNTESVKDCVENINKNMKELDLLTNLIKIAFNLDSEEDPRACKYGCPMLFDEKIKQEEHEAHCMSQPFECPFLDCVWFEKLERLVTHIYDTHNQVVLNADTTFTINFDSELSCDAGPSNSKLTAIFLQLFKDRLAVISVIGNFQTMQVFIYIQYVNDNYHCHSTATLQVSHPDGMFHQWSGRIQPLTVNPETLIAEESCIVFNTTADQMAAGLFSLRSKISIQEHSLPL